jgi:very-short-patch-repair endonuclease
MVQFHINDVAGRFVARVDLAYPLAYPRVRLAIEYDGDHHRDRATFQRDVARLNALRLCGRTVLRFTADDVLRHPHRVLAQVRILLGVTPRT